MIFEWDENKNKSNIQKHGIDFNDSANIFDHAMVIKLDKRADYGESRWIGLGQLESIVIIIVFTKRNDRMRIISIRKASKQERRIYFEKSK